MNKQIFSVIISGIVSILICIGVATTLHSCSEPVYKEVDGRKVELLDDNTLSMQYVEFDGHEYVKYFNGYRGSMCHSPKCHCLTEYKK